MNPPSRLHSGRRLFLRNLWALSSASALSGMPWTGLLLAKISPGTGVVRLKVGDLPALAEEGGSMRFSAGPLAPVMINRGPGNVFYAMSIVCAHQGCFVPTYNSVAGSIRCSCHGSRYAIDGSLIAGPALKGLERFTTAYDGIATLEVRIPDLAFDAKIISIQAKGDSIIRLALSFPAAAFSEYRVYQHTTLGNMPTPTLFATTPAGSASQETIKPTRTGDVTVYVDTTQSHGFYSVSLVLNEYQD